MIELNFPNFDERNGKIDTLVLHCLAYDVKEGMQTFVDNNVSSHYMIGYNAKIYRLVAEDKRAWHCGISYWKNRESLNHNSIGIEICSPTLGQEKYDQKQILALVRLCKKLIKKYHIKKTNVVAHSDIAPTRKPDPGKAFPWKYLAKHGIGLWYNIKNAEKVCDKTETEMLSEIGYNTSNLLAAKWAFCRHFLPQIVPYDTIENLINKPVPEMVEKLTDNALYLKTLKAVYYSYCRS